MSVPQKKELKQAAGELKRASTALAAASKPSRARGRSAPPRGRARKGPANQPAPSRRGRSAIGPRSARGPRPASLAATANVDRGRVSGHDYLTTLQQTGVESKQVTVELPGQVIYKVQLQPYNMIPNARMRNQLRNFEKVRPRRIGFEFRSEVPPGLNAGTMLFIYEPNPLEALPDVSLGSAAENRAALSKYDAHSCVAIMKIPQLDKGATAPIFWCDVRKQVGPFGGWFFVDPANVQPIQNTSFGQFAVMIQAPLNALGSSGSYGGAPINLGDLIVHYDLDVSVANIEEVGNDTFPIVAGSIKPGAGASYATPLGGITAPFSNAFTDLLYEISGAAGTPRDDFQTTIYAEHATNHIQFTVPQISGNGFLGVFTRQLGTASDAGTYKSYSNPTATTSNATVAGAAISSGVTSAMPDPNFSIIYVCPPNAQTPTPGANYFCDTGALVQSMGTLNSTTTETMTFVGIELPSAVFTSTVAAVLDTFTRRTGVDPHALMHALMSRRPVPRPLEVKEPATPMSARSQPVLVDIEECHQPPTRAPRPTPAIRVPSTKR